MAEDAKNKMKEILKLVTPAPKKATLRKKKGEPTGSQSIVGNGNIQAGRDVFVNKRETIRNEVKPGPEHITAAQARKIQGLVEKAVSIEEAAGGDRQALFAKWWGIVKNQYNVPTYREIPAHLGDQAIAWLTQQIAIKRPKLRRTDNTSWRNEHYKAIWAKARQLGFSKGDVYALVLERIGVQVVSLTKLGEQNLKKLYNIIMAMKG